MTETQMLSLDVLINHKYKYAKNRKHRKKITEKIAKRLNVSVVYLKTAVNENIAIACNTLSASKLTTKFLESDIRREILVGWSGRKNVIKKYFWDKDVCVERAAFTSLFKY